jgi:hypothetical protein
MPTELQAAVWAAIQPARPRQRERLSFVDTFKPTAPPGIVGAGPVRSATPGPTRVGPMEDR